MNIGWLIKMAWRDSRRNRSRLLLFISSIVLGIAALVAIYSLAENVRNDVDAQAATLIGADLKLSVNKSVKKSTQKLLDSLPGQKSEERSFVSMIFFPKNEGTRLVQVKALRGAFPYYGSLETSPANAGRTFREAQEAIVDRTLMLQFNAQVGDSIKVGDMTFAIAGTLLKAPGQTGIAASVAPTVYIPLRYLDSTGLSKKGSRINYTYYYKFSRPDQATEITRALEPRFQAEGLDADTIESQKEQTGRAFSDLTNFLSLVGFIALLLGCVGVASAVNIYIREKINTIAILRCLGVQSYEAFLIYLLQILGIGFIGSVAGAALGVVIQQFLPIVLKDFVAITITTGISWIAILQGVALGLIISLIFALLPLITLRNVSPLNTLRVVSNEGPASRDNARWLVYIFILIFIIGFSYLQLNSMREALFFTGGILLAFLLLTGTAQLLIYAVRRFFPSHWSYLWRQGLSNLFRPNNQTVILIVSIGLGTFFISTLFSVQSLLLNRITLSAGENQPNMVLFDIQSNQKDSTAQIARQFNLPVVQQVPIVNMRLEKINGNTAAMLNEADSSFSRRAFSREYRVTYRDSLTSSEEITKGKWYGTVDTATGDIYISVEQGWAKRQGIAVGDTMVFNVQGAMMSTIVGSLREVDWNRIQTNFLVVFPQGVLEEAPQFHVLLTRVQSDEESARFQRAMVKRFPNISIIDLGLVLKTIDEIISKISFVIRFMAGFSIITGVVVLIASVLISKFQRIQESVLLRTLGASRRQVLVITALEYLFLGALAAFTGIFLSLAGTWTLATYSFKTAFYIETIPLVILFVSICALTVAIGLLNTRGVLNKPPLEILRSEA